MGARHPIPIETLKRLLRYDEDGRLFGPFASLNFPARSETEAA